MLVGELKLFVQYGRDAVLCRLGYFCCCRFCASELVVDVRNVLVAVCSSVGQTRYAHLARQAYHQCWRVRVQFLSGTLDFLL